MPPGLSVSATWSSKSCASSARAARTRSRHIPPRAIGASSARSTAATESRSSDRCRRTRSRWTARSAAVSTRPRSKPCASSWPAGARGGMAAFGWTFMARPPCPPWSRRSARFVQSPAAHDSRSDTPWGIITGMEHIIIGGVAGGMSAATRLRRLDEDAHITVIERSGHVSFANCGLPYHVGGVIEDRGSLLLQTPASLGRRFGLDVRVGTEAVQIDRERRVVVVRELATETVSELPYDDVLLSPGARPVRPPIPGIERALSLRDIEDTDALVASSTPARTAPITGGGGQVLVPLANTANRQGRMAADVMAGLPAHDRPVLGTAIVGIFGLQVATTGWSEKRLVAAGSPHRVIHTHPAAHATYYPGAEG